MAATVDFAFAAGGGIAVQVNDAEVAAAGPVTRGFDAVATRGFDVDAVAQATQSFDAAMAGLHRIADSLHAALQQAVAPPDTVTVQFGVDFSVKSGLVVVQGSGGATLNVTMTWKKA